MTASVLCSSPDRLCRGIIVMSDGNKALAGYARAEIKEKKSVFIGSALPVKTEEEARAFIEKTKKEFHDARHNVFAYILDGGNIMRYTDDGEPKGSAGIPVLNVLRMNNIDNACVVVTRYFGGILLGTGGLVRAYGAAAKAAVDAAGICEVRMFSVFECECTYNDYQKITARLSSAGAVEKDSVFSDTVLLRGVCPEANMTVLSDLVTQITLGKSEVRIISGEEKLSEIG